MQVYDASQAETLVVGGRQVEGKVTKDLTVAPVGVIEAGSVDEVDGPVVVDEGVKLYLFGL